MIRRPPRSTLFPTRRSSDLGLRRDHLEVLLEVLVRGAVAAAGKGDALARRALAGARVAAQRAAVRSEEHTSELQSRQYLVCRPLLDKTTHNRAPVMPRSPPT